VTDFKAYWVSEFQSHADAIERSCAALQGNFVKLIDVCTACIQSGGKILFAGNGGSAADAQHLATELTVRYVKDRAPIAALALTTDTSTLTAAGNDYGFDYIFSRQIEALGNKGDVFIAISTSGNSPNIIRALESARQKNVLTVGLSGHDGGKMKEICDVCLIVPSDVTARIQEVHILIGHMLCGALEHKLNLVVENP
jgi:D-sedoheptulose 7-phosphate isomerase